MTTKQECNRDQIQQTWPLDAKDFLQGTVLPQIWSDDSEHHVRPLRLSGHSQVLHLSVVPVGQPAIELLDAVSLVHC